MLIWLVFALMTGAAVLAVLWPLSRAEPAGAAEAGDAAFFRQQIADLERDREAGLVSESEAEALRAEIGRRLLRASRADGRRGPEGEPALRRRRAASAIALSTIPLLALATYGAMGSPHLPQVPLAARMDGKEFDVGAAVAKIEAHLAQNPGDGRGWEVLAPVYLRAGRFGDAARAYQSAIDILGETPSRLTDLGEAVTAEAGGIVDARARAAFERALALDPANPKARYYLALAAGQDGDSARAADMLQKLLADAPADAPWRGAVEQRLAALSASASANAIVSQPQEEQARAIRGMVEGLAARLEADGSDAAGWARLVRSYVVLGEKDKAREALDKARKQLAADAASLDMLTALARELSLETDGTGARQ